MIPNRLINSSLFLYPVDTRISLQKVAFVNTFCAVRSDLLQPFLCHFPHHPILAESLKC